MDDPSFKKAVAAAKLLLTETQKSAARDPEAARKAMDEIEARLVTHQASVGADLVALGLNMWRSFMGLPPSSAFLRRVASGTLEEDTARSQMLQLLTARQKQLESGGARG